MGALPIDHTIYVLPLVPDNGLLNRSLEFGGRHEVRLLQGVPKIKMNYFNVLKEMYPNVPDWHINFFLNVPNSYAGEIKPADIEDVERVKKLFRMFLNK